MRHPFLAALLCLAAACSASRPQTIVDKHLGTTTHSSATHRAGGSSHYQIHVRALAVEAATMRNCTLLTYVTRSDLNFPKIETVRSFGRTLPYERIDRQRAGTLRAEAGRIKMTCDQFARLSEVGLTFRMYGPRGTYDAVVAGRIFAEAALSLSP